MKRGDLIRHLLSHDCYLHREGGKHSIYYHPINKTFTSVSRQNEIPDRICYEICKQLGIPKP